MDTRPFFEFLQFVGSWVAKIGQNPLGLLLVVVFVVVLAFFVSRAPSKS